MSKSVIAALAVFVLLASPAMALTVFFQRDLGVKDFMRHCQYSDGKVYTVDNMDLCPMSVEAGFSYGNSSSGGGMMGFFKGEYQDGMTKVCVYDVLGEDKGLRVKSFELCPLSPRF